MADLTTADRMRERTDVNRVWFWLLLGANRWVVTAVLGALVFGTFMGWGITKSTSLQATMQASDMVETVFAGLVGAVITVSTLVVSINQLVLSQEIGSLGSQRSRMDVTMDFRESTDDLLGETTPADPAAFIDALIAESEERAQRLREAIDESEHPELGESVDTYVADLLENADHARKLLVDSDFGTFDVVQPALDFNYGQKMHDVRRLGREHEDELTEKQLAAFREVLVSLTMYGPVREYVKALYIQWALVKLSRAILYATVVALTVAGGMVVFVDATTFTGRLFGVETILWVVSAAFTISTLPFLVFTSYILRLATLAKQTLTVEPLILR
ncbi:hypothetical protein L593_00535 [Salinarchaeum sp. Harcht-Bsk1]|uniref:hypothetical protein n=1 Tax=Salinarchaeum sp. Harcht-Bsk1 TaxID=1333523 RepID=UPI0003423112|nr:hypothetical protein [Salinarchaeum sp. Harcht-Bsk1]AGN00062.1 hypothetical protein L593_00535 [Salinarchaeum sp. Harcht-Bsk1]